MQKKILIFIVFILIPPAVPVPAGLSFMWPVAYKPKLTGGFGEFRNIRFHHGIDISTGGTTGHKVYAAQKGYVSSVLYQHYAAGYGIFVTHPGGYNTFYCHLKNFSWLIRKHPKIKKYQMHIKNKRNFRIDLSPGEIPVKKGSVIAYSGNTGGVPPHLHFEIRKGADLTVNPLLNGIHIRDRRGPVIRKIHLKPLTYVSQVEDNDMPAIISASRKRGRVFQLSGKQALNAFGLIGVKVDAYDPWGAYKLPVYGMKLYVDNKLVFQRHLKKIYRSRSYSAGIVYDYDHSSVKRFTYYLYSRDTKKGALKINENKKNYRVTIKVYDPQGNTSSLAFNLTQGRPQQGLSPKKINLKKGEALTLKSSDSSCVVSYEKDAALYGESVNLATDPQPKLFMSGMASKSPLYSLSPSHLCVLKPPKVSITYTKSDKQKVGIYTMHNDIFYFAGNHYDEKTQSFVVKPVRTGSFFLARDDIKPRASFKNNRTYRRPSRILIRANDTGSGLNIARCIVTVDGKKVYWAHDILWRKSFIEIFQHNEIWSKGKHTIGLYLEDNAGNNRAYKFFYYRK